MTELEWLECTDPLKMLEFLRGKATDRKLRLFAVACCRRIWQELSEGSLREAVRIAESYVDGKTTARDLLIACTKANEVCGAIYESGDWALWAASQPAYAAVGEDPLAELTATEEGETDQETSIKQKMMQPPLLRDVFGNPFRPLTFAPSCRTPTVTALAQTIYDDRRFDDLPVLADALEEAGCTNEDILNHCRGPGPHVRGCWVVDLLLDKK